MPSSAVQKLTPIESASKKFRATLINEGYKEQPVNIFFKASTDTETPIAEQFARYMAKWLITANKPYSTRKYNKSGIWYAEDYVKKHGSSLVAHDSINYIAHPKYWDVSIYGRFQENTSNQYTSSERLNAFFQGPTIAECAAVLQACMYRAIEEIVGTEAFNNYFGKPLTIFMLTSNLFANNFTKESLPDFAAHKSPLDLNNPLYYLFAPKISAATTASPSSLIDSDINPGDIVYMKGVDKYTTKHLEGSGMGWNLLCIGKNESGKNLYIGFSLYRFDTPKTYAEMHKIFIESYNHDQSLDTRQRIYQFRKEPKSKLYTVANKSAALTCDKVGYDYPIGGIICAMTLNHELLKDTIMEQDKHRPFPWHTTPEQILFADSSGGNLRNFASFSNETKGKDFSNYIIQTDTQRKMLSIVKKFTQAVVNRKENQPIGLVLSGSPGIGKTHLCVAAAKYSAQSGVDVLFIDEDSIENTYQKLSSTTSDEHMDRLFEAWIGKSDLIVFDNASNEYGIGNLFLKRSIEYILKYNKALLICSNHPVNIKKNIPFYIGYNHPLADNFRVVGGLEGLSYRKKWWHNTEEANTTAKLPAAKKIKLLQQYQGDECAGIIIQDDKFSLEEIKKQFLDNTHTSHKVKIIAHSFISVLNNKAMNNSVFDDNEYDAFIIRVTKASECEYFLKLIPQLYNKSKKVIVATNCQENLGRTLQELLISSYKKQSPVLTDRIEHIFPEKLLSSEKNL